MTHADRSDPASAPLTLTLAEANLVLAGSAAKVEEAVMDKGYHDNGLLAECAQRGVRTYIPERRQKSRCWTNKPVEYETAFRANRRRVRAAKGRQLNRWRSERCERTFAHVCETGGGRRSWLRRVVNVSKTYVLKCGLQLGGAAAQGLGPEQTPDGRGAFVGVIGALGRLVEPNSHSAGPTDQHSAFLVMPELLPPAAPLGRGIGPFFNGLLDAGGRCVEAFG
jgi:hypothetical protein